jgi:hypothetical protein
VWHAVTSPITDQCSATDQGEPAAVLLCPRLRQGPRAGEDSAVVRERWRREGAGASAASRGSQAKSHDFDQPCATFVAGPLPPSEGQMVALARALFADEVKFTGLTRTLARL